MSGHFITFEGGDGAGKTTLIEGVRMALTAKGHDVLVTRAPGGTGLGLILRKLILHPEYPPVPRAEILLFLADRAQQVQEVILPALSAGKVVLCDRYNDSTLAYQGGARGLNLADIEQLCAFATEDLRPSLTLYLDIDPEIGLKRAQDASKEKDQIESEDLSFHENIRFAFHRIHQKDPSRFQIVDATQSKEAVLNDALNLIDANCFAKRS